MREPRGYVLYEGPSELDGRPIVAVLTLRSKNEKTGPMAQLWILCADVAPLDALRSGADSAICGDCPLRGDHGHGRSCYVQVARAPAAVWQAWRRGIYPVHLHPARAGAGRRIRLGAYGDPAAVPAHILRALVSRADTHTGYTHMWDRADIADFVMASVHSAQGAATARARGYRVFWSGPEDGSPPAGERLQWCPATPERGYRLTCATCRACEGSAPWSRRTADVFIRAHGAGKKYLRVLSA